VRSNGPFQPGARRAGASIVSALLLLVGFAGCVQSYLRPVERTFQSDRGLLRITSYWGGFEVYRVTGYPAGLWKDWQTLKQLPGGSSWGQNVIIPGVRAHGGQGHYVSTGGTTVTVRNWRVRALWLILCLFGAILPVFRTARWFLRRHPLPPGCCSRCGYDLRATPDRCPECGHRDPAVKKAAGIAAVPKPLAGPAQRYRQWHERGQTTRE
jgi:hypothetical protein